VRALMLLVSLLLGTAPLAQAAERPARPVVLASIEPLAMLLRDVLGDHVDVQTFLLPSQTPHDSSFTPGQARRVQQANLIVWLGGDAEPALGRLMARFPGAQLAMLSLTGIHQREMQDVGDHHGHSHKHAHGALDPHLWLSIHNMLLLAQALPDQADHLGLERAAIQLAVEQLSATLTAQRERLRTALEPLANQPYMSHHDAWGYFAEEVGLRPVIPLTASTDLTPGSRRFTRLVQQIEQEGIRCFMAEPESRRALIERLCRGECRLVEADPLGRSLGAVGYGALLEDLGRRFSQCLGEPAS
jgi:zinc transport system substrate-binding protein